MNNILSNYINHQLNEVPSVLNRRLSSFKGIKYNQRDDFNILKKRIDDYLNKDSDERFFLLPGLRGVGKTTLLFQIYEYLLKQKDISPTDILYISCDDINATEETNLKEIIETYLENIHNTTPALLEKPIFLLADEVHYDTNWALNTKILYDKSPYIFMILTGSSSLHLDYNADAARRLKIHDILPLNYSTHLKLKYNYYTSISEDLINVLFTGNIENAQKEENKINKDLINNINYTPNDWETYFKYGGFCTTLNKKYITDMTGELWNITSKIITQDITPTFNLNKKTQDNVYRVLVLISSQKPGEISQNKVAASLSKSTSVINNIFNILEQTKIIFHYQAYGGAQTQSKKSWKYYLATASLKNGVNKKFGHTITDQRDYDGILLENLVASSLYNLKNQFRYDPNNIFNVFYDKNKGGVDFIIQKEFNKPIPIEVGLGNKKDKQVRKFLNKYNSSYGIIVSNKTDKIEKEDNIIYMSPKTFSYI
ncbi:MAG: ATP-binding protein [Methanosphaera stadtmanae]|nr:ATP-binding protein [Methanosphaera stadtmanae]